MGLNVNDIATPSASNSWDPQVGDIVEGEVALVKLMNPKPNYNRTANEQEIRLDLDNGGVTTTVWAVINTDVGSDAGYPSRLARAIATAVRKAGCEDLEEGPGSWLKIQRIADVQPTQAGRSPAKEYVAEYRPPRKGIDMTALAPTPNVVTPPAAADPFAGLMGQPVPLPMPTVLAQHRERMGAIFGMDARTLTETTPVTLVRMCLGKGLDDNGVAQVLTVAYGVDTAQVAEWLAEARATQAQAAPVDPLAALLGG